MAEAAEGKAGAGEGEKRRQEQSLAFYELFAFADRYDLALMVAGSLGAVVHGSAMPVFFLQFGDSAATAASASVYRRPSTLETIPGTSTKESRPWGGGISWKLSLTLVSARRGQ